MNFYKRYMGDYGRATGHLSLAEHGVYALLLDHYYSSMKPLPYDIVALQRICGAINESEIESITRVSDEFFPVDKSDGLRHNKRADEELLKWQAQAAVNIRISRSRGGKINNESIIGSNIESSIEPINESVTTPEVRSQIYKDLGEKLKTDKRKIQDLPCDYCSKPSVGKVNNYRFCREHTDKAINGLKP